MDLSCDSSAGMTVLAMSDLHGRQDLFDAIVRHATAAHVVLAGDLLERRRGDVSVREGQRECLGLPVVVEHDALRLVLDRSVTLGPTEIGVGDVGIAHDESASDATRGSSGRPTPIIESRVTSSASCSSLHLSVLGGRRGITR